MNKFKIIFLVLVSIPQIVFADCKLINPKELLACEKLVNSSNYIAVTNDENGISVKLLKNDLMISEFTGLGYKLDEFNYNDKKVNFKIVYDSAFSPVVIVRTMADTSSLVRFFSVKEADLNPIKVLENEKKKSFLATLLDSSVSISKDKIVISSHFYKSEYSIDEDIVTQRSFVKTNVKSLLNE